MINSLREIVRHFLESKPKRSRERPEPLAKDAPVTDVTHGGEDNRNQMSNKEYLLLVSSHWTDGGGHDLLDELWNRKRTR